MSKGKMKSKRRKLNPNAINNEDWDETALQAAKSGSTNNLPADIVTPNFTKLASTYPDFATQWENLQKRQRRITSQKNSRKKGTSSFSTHVDFDFNLALTRALLREYFQLSLPSLPEGYLCPPIPNRLNYVLWIKDLLYEAYDCNDEYFAHDEDHGDHEDHGDKERDSSNGRENMEMSDTNEYSSSSSQHYSWGRSYRGMDIGCGASCIYPLLLSSKYFDGATGHENKKWQFLGTDIDPCSIRCAQENIDANQLQHQIKLALVPPTTDQAEQKGCGDSHKSDILENDKANGGSCDNDKNASASDYTHNELTPIHTAMKAASTVYSDPNSNSIHFDFCMTNPPFYATVDEATTPRAGDERDRTPMTTFESVYPGSPIGGEVKFVLDMIHGSLHHKDHITWFTAMLGKKSSLIPIEKKLESLGLSRGCIRKTEFLQGKMIRWGIAWTFRRPAVRSKVTLINEEMKNFHVNFDKPLLPLEALHEISDRIKCFCEHYCKGSEIKYYQNSDTHFTLEELFQPSFKNLDTTEAKTQNQSAPRCQYLLDIYIEVRAIDTGCNDDSGNIDSGKLNSVTIGVECYCHYKSAMGRIHNLRNQLTGEIARTNRRWRRRSKQGKC